MTQTTESPLSQAIATGLKAARANLVPGIALQAFALALVLAYAFWPPASEALNRLALFRTESGLAFGVVSTGLCGGLVPWLYMSLFSRGEGLTTPGKGLLTTLFWAYKGIEVEMLFRFLAWLVGESPGPLGIAGKVLFDQFVYGPVLAIPLTVIVYSWAEYGYSLSGLAADMRRPGWYLRRVLTPLVANIGIWLPAATLIYTLPTALQLPMQNLVLVFFTLILARVARHAPARNEAQAALKTQ